MGRDEEKIYCDACEKNNSIAFVKWIRKNQYIQASNGWFLSRQLNQGIISDEELFEIYKQTKDADKST